MLISVGELTGAQLTLLLNRVKRVFEGSAIVIGYWGGPSTAQRLGEEHDEDQILAAETVDSLLHSVGRIADTTPATSL